MSIETQGTPNREEGNTPVVVQQRKRPKSVTVVAWIILVTTGLSFITVLLISLSGEEFEFQMGQRMYGVVLAVGFAGGAIGIVSGITMLRGLNWGRLLFLVGMPIVNILKWSISGFAPTSVVTILCYFLFLYFLTTPIASGFFRQEEADKSKNVGA